MPHCRACGCDAVFWGKRKGRKPYDKGAFVLLDREPSPVGIYALIDGRVVLADETVPRDVPRFTPHSAMCERAGRERPSAEMER